MTEHSELEISTDPGRLDIDMVHRFLSTSSYWAKGRPRSVVERTIEHSLCFGVYRQHRQIGFGRVISDFVVIGYLADVFVLPEWRGRGVGSLLMRSIVDHPDLKDLQLMMLRTRDAHRLYARFGFSDVLRPEELMARHA